MQKPEFLTKSRFKEGLDCITKLYYTGKKLEYANQKLDDPFLLALADGGYQVGTLALYLFSNVLFALEANMSPVIFNKLVVFDFMNTSHISLYIL